MGEVYRATDTKLRRDVALKVLPAEMASRPRSARALPARGEGPRRARPPEHRHRLLGRRGRRRPLPDDAARGGPAAGPPDPRTRPAHRAHRRGHHGAGRRARHRAREGHRASRPEAGQRDGDARGPREGARLRPREGAARWRSRRRHVHVGGPDPGWRRDGHARVYVARAGGGAPGGSPHRPLLARRAALRDGERAATLRRRLVRGARLGDPARHASALGRDQDGPGPGAGARHPALPGEGPAPAHPDGARRRQRAARVAAEADVLRGESRAGACGDRRGVGRGANRRGLLGGGAAVHAPRRRPRPGGAGRGAGRGDRHRAVPLFVPPGRRAQLDGRGRPGRRGGPAGRHGDRRPLRHGREPPAGRGEAARRGPARRCDDQGPTCGPRPTSARSARTRCSSCRTTWCRGSSPP